MRLDFPGWTFLSVLATVLVCACGSSESRSIDGAEGGSSPRGEPEAGFDASADREVDASSGTTGPDRDSSTEQWDARSEAGPEWLPACQACAEQTPACSYEACLRCIFEEPPLTNEHCPEQPSLFQIESLAMLKEACSDSCPAR